MVRDSSSLFRKAIALMTAIVFLSNTVFIDISWADKGGLLRALSMLEKDGGEGRESCHRRLSGVSMYPPSQGAELRAMPVRRNSESVLGGGCDVFL